MILWLIGWVGVDLENGRKVVRWCKFFVILFLNFKLVLYN